MQVKCLKTTFSCLQHVVKNILVSSWSLSRLLAWWKITSHLQLLTIMWQLHSEYWNRYNHTFTNFQAYLAILSNFSSMYGRLIAGDMHYTIARLNLHVRHVRRTLIVLLQLWCVRWSIVSYGVSLEYQGWRWSGELMYWCAATAIMNTTKFSGKVGKSKLWKKI